MRVLHSLQARLFASYFLLLAITLVTIIGALVILLNSRPEPPLTTYQRLAGVARTILTDDLPSRLRLRNYLETIATRAEANGARLMALDGQSREVYFDSLALFGQNTVVEYNVDNTYRINSALSGGSSQILQSVFGSFRDPSDQSDWLFIGVRVGTVNSVLILLSDRQSTRTLQDSLSEFGTSLALPVVQSALIGLVVAFLIAAFISRQIARQLQKLAQAAHAVASGNMDAQVPLEGAPEVRAVAEAFNTMVAEVRTTQQAQRDFLANVSHDLKTPLTSIQGYSQAIIDGAVRDPAVAAEVIFSEADRLTHMVLELTDLARLQSGRVMLNLNRIDVGALVKALAERIVVTAEKKQVRIGLDVANAGVIVGDGDRLTQVINNLLSNAVKFTPEGGRIEIRGKMLDGGVQLSVTDSGMGIPKGDLTRVFERFYQVDKARGPKRGTGLGLAIAREIVQAHGGRIEASSPGEDRGTTFVVWLPETPPMS
jgi:signal transduction histidine kinase